MRANISKIGITVAVLLIVSINNNVTEYLTGQGYSAPLMMIFYATVALILNCIVGGATKQSIFPKQWKFQRIYQCRVWSPSNCVRERSNC